MITRKAFLNLGAVVIAGILIPASAIAQQAQPGKIRITSPTTANAAQLITTNTGKTVIVQFDYNTGSKGGNFIAEAKISGSNGWARANQTTRMNAGLGSAQIEIPVDNNAPAGSYTVQVIASNDRTGQDRFYDVENASNAVIITEPAPITPEVEEEVPGDTDAPTTSAELSAPANAAGWHKGDVTVNFTASDNEGGSGVASTSYKVNDGAWTSGASVELTAEGEHTVSFKSVDVAGNSEVAQSVAVKIDKTNPTLEWVYPAVSGANGWYAGPVTLDFSTDDNLSGVVSPAENTVTISTQGSSQTATVTVTDTAGNSAEFTSEPLNIDFTAPTTTVHVLGHKNPQGKYTGNVVVNLTAVDNVNGSGVAATWYRIDGKEARLFQGSFVVAGVGTHTVEVSSVDVAGNVEVIHSVTITIEKPVNRR